MTEPTYDPGPLHEVATEPAGPRWTLVFIRELKHPIERVWAAVSDPDHLRQWAPYTADRPLDHTGAFTVIDNHSEDAPTKPGQVTFCDPPRLLEQSWDVDVLRWELEDTGAGTRLTLRHTLEDRQMASKVAAGWHLCLNVADTVLDGQPMPVILGEAAKDYGWEQLDEKYAELLGIHQDPRP